MTSRRPLPVRTRLTLWYVGVLALLLSVFTVIVAVLYDWQVRGQIYHDQVQDIETVEGLLYFTADGRLALHEEYHSSPHDRDLIDRYMEVLTPAGQVLYRNARTTGLELGGPVTPDEGVRSFARRRVVLSDGQPVQMISHRHPLEGRTLVIRLAYSLQPIESRMRQFVTLAIIVLPMALATAAVTGQLLTARALLPLEAMASHTERLTAAQLHERLTVRTPDDELGRIARAFNGLLSRLETAFEQLTQFSSDVAHELRTPLAAIRSVGEVGLQQTRSPDAYREIIGSMLEETSRLTEIVDGLLLLSRGETAGSAQALVAFPFSDIVHEAVGLVDILAQERHVTIDLAEHVSAYVKADRLLLRLAIINVLHNAIKHSPTGGHIMVRLEGTAAGSCPTVRLEIQDEGAGVSAADRERVFQRFYRVDDARSRETGGVGLGLAIARWAVSRSKGTIQFEPPKRGGALCVIRLPALTSLT